MEHLARARSRTSVKQLSYRAVLAHLSSFSSAVEGRPLGPLRVTRSTRAYAPCCGWSTCSIGWVNWPPGDTAVDHHYAIATLFEIIEVASRADLKVRPAEGPRTAEVPTQQATAANPSISEKALDEVIEKIDHAPLPVLNELPGKGRSRAHQQRMADEQSAAASAFQAAPASSICPPTMLGKQHEPAERRADLARWIALPCFRWPRR